MTGRYRATCYAHSHDGGDLRNSHGGHDGVVAENAAEIVGVGEDVFLQRQENARGIDEIDRGDAVVDGDVLGADDLLGGHREERASFDGGVVHDEHDEAALHTRESGHDACRRCAAPFLVHAPGCVGPQLKKRGTRVDQRRDPLACGHPLLFVLRFDGLGAATLLDLLFVHAEAGHQFGYGMRVALEAGGGRLYTRGYFGGSSGVLVLSHDGRSCTRRQTVNDKAVA